MEVVSTKIEDFDGVVSLINHVFGKENTPIKMENIFSDLLSENNMEHMLIIKEDEKPVSVVNYILNEIDINGSKIKAASIGAVCTHEDYRRKGYSNQILNVCLDKMKTEEVDFLYVSGDIDLYTKNNIQIAGKMYKFNIDMKDMFKYNELLNDTYAVRECSQEDFSDIYAFYDAESVKFVRNKQKFLELVDRIPGAAVFNYGAKIFCVEDKGEIQGYFIGAMIPKENGDFEMEVIEYAGKRITVMTGLIKTMARLNLARITGFTPWFDTDMVMVLKEYYINTEVNNYPGTMRIMDFTRFMQKLKPLYAQANELENIEFYETEEKYYIRSGNREFMITDDKVMHQLFLGNDLDILKNIHISGDNTLVEKIKLTLPIPVPYPYNLNYI